MSIEILNALASLNEAFYESIDAEELPGFEYRGDGYNGIVDFMGTTIWSDDDDSRRYNEDTDEYEESYFDCFKREALTILEKLKEVQRTLEIASNSI